MHPLAERVLSHIRRQELLRAGDRVGVAVSGGIDSVALLRLMLEVRGELGIVLSVVHFNHKLRGAESEADERFVADLAREHGLEFFGDNDDVARIAAEERISLEAAARDVRYGFFRYLLGSEGCTSGAEAQIQTDPADRSAESAAPPKSVLTKVATGHTLDDQAETVLMRMIRGAGMRGLGGIHARIVVEDDNGDVCGEIVRPLLVFRRRELEQYLKDIGQGWREDSSNDDDAFTRNRVRRLLLPLLEKEFNPSVRENLAELAEIARGEEDYWENEVAGWMGTAVHWSEPEWARVVSEPTGLIQISAPKPPESKKQGDASAKRSTLAAPNAARMGHTQDPDLKSRIDTAPWLVANAAVDRVWFLGEPGAVQRRVARAVGEHAGIPLEFKHVEEILEFAAKEGQPDKELSLPLGWRVRCQRNELLFLTPDLRDPAPQQDYEYSLTIPGQIAIHEAGLTIEVRNVPAKDEAHYNPDELLDADALPGPLRVRNWRAGDRFWPAHTKSAKKIKELLQGHHVPAPERRRWPVVVSGDEIVWVRDFAACAKFRPKPGHAAILITALSITAVPSAVGNEEKRNPTPSGK